MKHELGGLDPDDDNAAGVDEGDENGFNMGDDLGLQFEQDGEDCTHEVDLDDAARDSEVHDGTHFMPMSPSPKAPVSQRVQLQIHSQTLCSQKYHRLDQPLSCYTDLPGNVKRPDVDTKPEVVRVFFQVIITYAKGLAKDRESWPECDSDPQLASSTWLNAVLGARSFNSPQRGRERVGGR
ncbi:hypothetical protein FKW77_005313 [Venturia effusa]|uniref:Uncharacterized protein n=1 Tax=Venturia effusa TaxID=50376 RepID=A0A517L1C0_9PEZI|nr:hypothetical protein FKW77_005313 [Venturia effusa]